ncbi:MAG: LptF/LptG family permease [Fusobacteriaceae bacterium]
MIEKKNLFITNKVEEELKISAFFADPHASFQRGRNENSNELLIEFFPKKTDLSKITNKNIFDSMKSINFRTRKHLYWNFVSYEFLHEILICCIKKNKEGNMKTIEKYILTQIKLPIIFSLTLFTFVFLIDIITMMLENIIVRGISVIDTIRILSFYLPPILTQTIPMSLFLGAMVTFSTFTRSSESVAMSSMGLSLKYLISPVLKLAVACFLFIIFLQEIIIPQSFEKLQFITQKIILENPSFQLQRKTFMRNIGDFSLYIDDIIGNESQRVLIFQKESDSPYSSVMFGEKALFLSGVMSIKNASFYKFNPTGDIGVRGKFDIKKVALTSFTKDIALKIKDIETKSFYTLTKEYKFVPTEKKVLYKLEMNKRFAVPLSILLLAVMGVLLSNGHYRSGKGANFALSLFIVFAYVILLNVGSAFAKGGKISVFAGVWTPNIILALVTYISYIKKSRVM